MDFCYLRSLFLGILFAQRKGGGSLNIQASVFLWLTSEKLGAYYR